MLRAFPLSNVFLILARQCQRNAASHKQVCGARHQPRKSSDCMGRRTLSYSSASRLPANEYQNMNPQMARAVGHCGRIRRFFARSGRGSRKRGRVRPGDAALSHGERMAAFRVGRLAGHRIDCVEEGRVLRRPTSETTNSLNVSDRVRFIRV